MSTTETVTWMAPAPLWGDGGLGLESPQLTAPWLVELAQDQFVSEFLGLMAAQGVARPTDIGKMAPGTRNGPNYRLFQPISQRYYLVTASLVCRRVGLPDRSVDRAAGETTTFVLRRLSPDDGSEQAMANGSWAAAPATALVAGEQPVPMHPAAVAGFAPPGSTASAFGMSIAGRRTVYYGYIPVGTREKAVPPMADPVGALQAVISSEPSATTLDNPLLGALYGRVVQQWSALTSAAPVAGTDTGYASLYTVLDLGDWLAQNLPGVYQALLAGSPMTETAQEALRQAIAAVTVGKGSPPPAQPPPPGWSQTPLAGTETLDKVLAELEDFESLVTGTGGAPPNSYDLVASSPPSATAMATWLSGPATPGSLAYLALAAVQEAGSPITVPAELAGQIKADPVVPPAGRAATAYIVRAVYQHDPCVPVLSQPSAPFELARAFDPDAPARQVRIQMPDVSNMRQFKRGIAIELPPSLRRITDRLTPKLLQGGGLGGDPGLELGMICAYSFQIFLVLSFMVAFMFLIVFNIIFWWLPFIKICFPVPVPTSSTSEPAP